MQLLGLLAFLTCLLFQMTAAARFIVTLEPAGDLETLKSTLLAKSAVIVHEYNIGSFKGLAFDSPAEAVAVTAESWQSELNCLVGGELSIDHKREEADALHVGIKRVEADQEVHIMA